MYDRIRIAENELQRYGSQLPFNEVMTKYELFPLEDAAKPGRMSGVKKPVSVR